jgi:hypothetical protein
VGLDKRCEVKIVIPPPDLTEIACKRTDGMVRYFHAYTQFMQWWHIDKYLSLLAQSAYMQGLHDGMEAMIHSAGTGRGGREEREMSCPICKRHSVICGLCGRCLQEHCDCRDAQCLKCGTKQIVPKDFKFNGFALHEGCGGQWKPKSRYA